ncbi:histidine kinase [Pseudoalteromonas sp. XMcav11-Q]|uniref:sensor histidine kinase n=1 Tax=Pseudoalteromonas sp. XMcav11-Q TaxID=3136665 RepID=UPI0032C49A23
MMDSPIRHTTDWRFSTLASWLGVTLACMYYRNSQLALVGQLIISGAILTLLFFIIHNPNKRVHAAACTYLVLIALLMQVSTTSLVFIHLVMFSAIFSPHFSFPKVLSAVLLAMLVYGFTHYTRWEGSVPWITFAVWLFFCAMNWFVSRRIVESLNMHYQSRQNYKELKAAQHMMGAMSAAQERLNISRELHDSLGHKLTALSINLDFAKRTANEDMEPTLASCHQLSQTLLEEVRSIVSTQRHNKTLLKQALEAIFTATPNLRYTLELDRGSEQISQAHSLCVIRFCQEMVSNTLKHTKANHINFEVVIDTANHNLKASAFHNQSESSLPKQGNGLSGLHERLALLNGSFTQKIKNQKLISSITIPVPELNLLSENIT